MLSERERGASAGSVVYSSLVLKIYDWWVLGVSNRYAWCCPTRLVLLPFFQRHLSKNHLDVGVGTGYYLEHASFAQEQRIALLDLNLNSLKFAGARIAPLRPSLVRENVLHPDGRLNAEKFDSISVIYLLHCLPGTMEEKATAAFTFLRNHLTENGTLYGATILGEEAAHNWFGRKLMKLYNKKGIFGNPHDSLLVLRSVLARYFVDVKVRQYGKVALFSAKLSA